MTSVRIENPNDHDAIVVRTYSDKGNSVNDGETIEPGQELVVELGADQFIQVDPLAVHRASNKQVAVEPEQTSEDDDVSGGGDDETLEPIEDENGNVMFDPNRVVSDEEAAATLAASDEDDESGADVDDDIDALLA